MIDITLPLLTDALNRRWKTHQSGPGLKLPLHLPILYYPEIPVVSGHVYVTRPEYLPPDNSFPRDALLICSGKLQRWNYGKDRFPLLTVECDDLLAVFNAVQTAFARCQEWSCSIERTAETTADLIEMVRLSLPIFENRIAILDQELYHLAITEIGDNNTDISEWTVKRSPSLSLEKIEKYSSVYRQYYSYHQQFSPYPGVYTLNLFVGETREGCVTLDSRHRDLTQSDFILFHYFANTIEKALIHRAVLASAQSNYIKSVMQDLLSHNPVNNNRIQQVRKRYRIPDGQSYVCIVLYPGNETENVPAEYLCTTLEKSVPSCTAVINEEKITALVLSDTEDGLSGVQLSHLEQFLTDTGMQAGISNSFLELRDLHMYYRQARNACEIGSELMPGRSYFIFQDHILTYMLYNCTGEFPISSLCPPALKKLYALSQSAGVDYWGTLRLFLDNNMNIAKTARELFLHRSTMLGRLAHIREIVGDALEDPGIQLKFRILMYLMDMDNSKNK